MLLSIEWSPTWAGLWAESKNKSPQARLIDLSLGQNVYTSSAWLPRTDDWINQSNARIDDWWLVGGMGLGAEKKARGFRWMHRYETEVEHRRVLESPGKENKMREQDGLRWSTHTHAFVLSAHLWLYQDYDEPHLKIEDASLTPRENQNSWHVLLTIERKKIRCRMRTSIRDVIPRYEKSSQWAQEKLR